MEVETFNILNNSKRSSIRREKRKSAKKSFILRNIDPQTKTQEQIFDNWDRGKNLFLYGEPKTGKTFLALYLALEELLDEKTEKIYVIRSAVPTRNIGFLPGKIDDKIREYEQPYIDHINNLFLPSKDVYKTLKSQNDLEFLITSYLRGITLDNCIIILDEIQNLDYHEINSVVTRAGHNVRIIFCGDIKQCDLINETSGFNKALNVSKNMKSFANINLTIDDIIGSELTKEWILAQRRSEAA